MKYPESIEIIDVGPRDGFQNVTDFIPTDTKIDIIGAMAVAGVKSFEITSFVSPKAIPQLRDSSEVTKSILKKYPNVRAIALAPNLRGAQNADACGIKDVTYVISASESHNKANVNRTINESLDEIKAVVKSLPELRVRLALATAFGCPFENIVTEEQVFDIINFVRNVGVKEISLCDTIGIANPAQVAKLARDSKRKYPELKFVMHLHNTRGLGLANTYAAIEEGVTSFETTVGGLGGCPFAPGAAGNTATEDLVNMLSGMNVSTGIDLHEYLKAVRYVADNVHAKLNSSMLNAHIYEFETNVSSRT